MKKRVPRKKKKRDAGDLALATLRRKLRSIEKRRGVDARAVFRTCASSNAGLSCKDLRNACEKCGVLLNTTAADALMRCFDTDQDGTVDWGEFRTALFPDTDDKKSAPGTASQRDDAKHLATGLEAIFAAFDADGDGRLDLDELKAISQRPTTVCDVHYLKCQFGEWV